LLILQSVFMTWLQSFVCIRAGEVFNSLIAGVVVCIQRRWCLHFS